MRLPLAVKALFLAATVLLVPRATPPAAAIGAPQLTSPADGVALTDLGPTLRWTLPSGTTQYQIQVVPFGGDGPGINLIRNAETSFTISAPRLPVGNYVMLPGMSYTWRVRASDKAGFAPESDNTWSPWTATRTFRTPPASSATLSPASPAHGSVSSTMSPMLRWADANTANFYYEIQVSGDTRFDTNPASATSFVYWNLVHGGVTSPTNSWQSPQLDPGQTYYWRVRPRVQGDGTQVEWSATWSFRTASNFAYGVNGGWDRLDRVTEMGFGWVKLIVTWKDLEPSRGDRQLDRIASTIERATSRGLKVLIRVDEPPDWASSRPGHKNAPPANDADLANIMGALATRYKGQVAVYELWNEQNLDYEWGLMDPDPIRYGEMLKAVYPRVKLADPLAQVITGGLSTTGDGESGPYLGDLYYLEKLVDPNRDGNPADGYSAWFDGIGTHPYGGPYTYDTPGSQAPMGTYFRRAEHQHNHVLSHGVDKPFWATEFGWALHPSEQGASCDLGPHFNQMLVSSQFQAQQLASAYQHAAANWPWMRGMFFFGLDMAADPWRPTCEASRFYSIMKADGTFLPAFAALRDLPK